MPRNFLNALKEESSIESPEIELDYQLKDHGLAAWYARTYDGALWKVHQSNRKQSAGIQVTRVNDDN